MPTASESFDFLLPQADQFQSEELLPRIWDSDLPSFHGQDSGVFKKDFQR